MLSILYGLENSYIPSSRLVRVIEKVSKNTLHFFDVFMMSSMSDFHIILQFFGCGKCQKCVETPNFHIEYVFLIGSTNLMSLLCNRLCVFDLLRHNRRKNAISSTRPI